MAKYFAIEFLGSAPFSGLPVGLSAPVREACPEVKYGDFEVLAPPGLRLSGTLREGGVGGL